MTQQRKGQMKIIRNEIEAFDRRREEGKGLKAYFSIASSLSFKL